MKKLLVLCGGLFSLFVCFAQQPAATPAAWTYAEIIAAQGGVPSSGKVIIDFGQETPILKNNYLKDSAGEVIRFNSGIEALNYMTARGWEFVQAYTSGEENSYTHYLLRRHTESPSEQ